MPTVGASCPILHTICLGAGDEHPPEEREVPDNSEYEEGIQDTAKGNALRDDFCSEVLANMVFS